MTNSGAPTPRYNPTNNANPVYRKFFGKTIAINVDKPGKDDFETVSGKVVDVNADTLAINTKAKMRLIEIKNIIGDVEILSEVTQARVQIRKIRDPGVIVRVHLASRHGVNLYILNAIAEDIAKVMHDKMDHSKLGHLHTKEADAEQDASRAKRLHQSEIDDSERSHRQHLADRHGQAAGMLNGIKDEHLRLMHEAINHNGLGHRHKEIK